VYVSFDQKDPTTQKFGVQHFSNPETIRIQNYEGPPENQSKAKNKGGKNKLLDSQKSTTSRIFKLPWVYVTIVPKTDLKIIATVKFKKEV
jgi:hypothetical protein